MQVMMRYHKSICKISKKHTHMDTQRQGGKHFYDQNFKMTEKEIEKYSNLLRK